MLTLHTNRLHNNNLHSELSHPQWSAVGLLPAAEGDAVLSICVTAALWWRLTHMLEFQKLQFESHNHRPRNINNIFSK